MLMFIKNLNESMCYVSSLYMAGQYLQWLQHNIHWNCSATQDH